MTDKLKPGRNVCYPETLGAKLEEIPFYTNLDAIGTTQFYNLTMLSKMVKLVATEGVYHMCEQLNCSWMVDLLAALQPRFCGGTLYVVYVVKAEDGGFYLMLGDADGNILYCLQYPTIDIEKNLKLFLGCDEDCCILMLPSEY